MKDARYYEFAKDLAALLDKHNANLCVEIEGDTHGIYDEGISVSFKNELEEGEHFCTWSDTYTLANGYSISAYDITDNIKD